MPLTRNPHRHRPPPPRCLRPRLTAPAATIIASATTWPTMAAMAI